MRFKRLLKFVFCHEFVAHGGTGSRFSGILDLESTLVSQRRVLRRLTD